jgi:hypothetical protein
LRTPETVYRGRRLYGPGCTIVGVEVTVNGRPLDPRASWKIVNHSPTGFEWGYSGSGPAQLALALVLDASGNRERAERAYQWWKSLRVSCWLKDGWEITAGQILADLDEFDRRERMRDPNYVPTVEEALGDPEGFVEGMREATGEGGGI